MTLLKDSVNGFFWMILLNDSVLWFFYMILLKDSFEDSFAYEGKIKRQNIFFGEQTTTVGKRH